MSIILLIAAILVAWLVFTALLKILKDVVPTTIAVLFILFILQLIFGIKPEELWQEIRTLPQTITHIFHK